MTRSELAGKLADEIWRPLLDLPTCPFHPELFAVAPATAVSEADRLVLVESGGAPPRVAYSSAVHRSSSCGWLALALLCLTAVDSSCRRHLCPTCAR
jgi:hypothetical protein